jgi:hypothetical protein
VNFCKTTLIIICVIFAWGLGAQNLLDTKEHTFLTGLLVQTANGKKDLVTANILARHELVSDNFSSKYGKVSKVLWAGEIELKNGAVINVNETAGIIIENKKLTEGLDIPGTGIKNLKLYLMEQKVIKEKYFYNANFITYDPNNEHLDARLGDMSETRHKIRGSISGVIGLLGLLESERRSKDDIYPLIAKTSSDVLTTYNSAMSIAPELDIQAWRDLKVYIEKIANDKRDFSNEELLQVYNEFCLRTETLFMYESLHFSVVYPYSLSDYVQKVFLTETDMTELIDNGRLSRLLSDVNTWEDTAELEYLMENISSKELSPGQFDIMSILAELLEKEKVRVSMFFGINSESIRKVDAINTLYGYTGLSKATDVSVVVAKVLEKMEEEISYMGKFSSLTLGYIAREDVLDVILLNLTVQDGITFVKYFREVLEVNKNAYNVDYYKKPEFKKVIESLKEIKSVVKK